MSCCRVIQLYQLVSPQCCASSLPAKAHLSNHIERFLKSINLWCISIWCFLHFLFRILMYCYCFHYKNARFHHHWAVVVSHEWAQASACLLQVSLSCALLCQIVSLQCLSRSSLHRLAGLPYRLFLLNGVQVVTREVHRSSLRRLRVSHWICGMWNFGYHHMNIVKLYV